MIIAETMDDAYEILEHSGILGMHWGIRRYQNADGSLTPAGRQRYMKDAKWRSKYEKVIAKNKAKTEAKEETAAQKHKKLVKSSDANQLYERRDELSNSEIRDRIDRIKLERELSQYVQHEPTKQEKAQKAVDAVLANATKIGTFMASPGGKMITDAVKKQFGIDTNNTNVNYADFIKNISGKTNDEVKAMADRVRNEQNIRKAIDAWNKASEQVKNQNDSSQNKASNRSGTYADGRSEYNAFDGTHVSGNYDGKGKHKNVKYNTNSQRDTTNDWFNTNNTSTSSSSFQSSTSRSSYSPPPRQNTTSQQNTNTSYSGTVTGSGTSHRTQSNPWSNYTNVNYTNANPSYSGTVTGSGTSHRTQSNPWSNYTDVNYSNVINNTSLSSPRAANYTNNGISTVNQLLGLPTNNTGMDIYRRR